MSSYQLRELKFRLKKLWRKWASVLAQGLIAIIVSSGGTYFWTSDLGQRTDLYFLQKFFEFRGPREKPEDVQLVAIDDFSYAKLGASPRQPFPRRFTAEAIERIVAAKPKVLILDANIPKENLDPEADARLEAALRAGPVTIWSGGVPLDNSDVTASNPTPELTIPSDERFRKAAKLELPMTVPVKHGVVSRIGFASKNRDLGEQVPISKALTEVANYKLDSPGSFDLINYYGPSGTIKRVSLYEFVGEFYKAESDDLIKDKVVLVGFQSLTRERGQIDKDELMISASAHPMYGVEIHANAIANLLDRSWLRRVALDIELYQIIVAGFVFTLIGIAFSPGKSVPLIAIIGSGIIILGYYLFAANNFWLAGIGTTVFLASFTMLGSALYHYIIISAFKSYLKKTFNFELEREI